MRLSPFVVCGVGSVLMRPVSVRQVSMRPEWNVGTCRLKLGVS